MDNITENNMIALLEECMVNGDKSIWQLWAWFVSERGLIERTIKDANCHPKPVEPLCLACSESINVCGGCDNTC